MFKPSNEDVPHFGFKSSLIVVGVLFIFSFVIPQIIDMLKLNLRWLKIILASVSGSLAVAYVLFFIESDKGATKGFYITIFFTFLLLFLITYFWFTFVLV